MYFWKIEKLKEDIKTENFRENDRFIYALISIGVSVISIEAIKLMPVENSNIWDTVNSIGNIIIPIAGTFFAYKANGGANGSDFLGRFFSINVVVTVRFFALLIPMSIALIAYYMYAFPEGQEFVSSTADVILFQVWFAFIYVRTCKHISDVNNS